VVIVHLKLEKIFLKAHPNKLIYLMTITVKDNDSSS